MKRKLTHLIILVMVLLLVFAFASCNESTDTDTSTDTGEINTNTSTESSTGDSTDSSSNSNTNNGTGTNNGANPDSGDTSHKHAEEILPAVEPTCTETGLTEGKKCSTCGEVLVEQEIVDALDHDYITNEAKAPSCTEIGWNQYQTCSRCDYSTYEPTPANGHSYDGGYTCLVCGDTIASSEGLAFNLSDDGTYAIVVGIGDCWDKAIYIPTEYRGFPVKEISSNAFKEKTYITEIYIPNTVTTIQAGSFSGCTALEKVTLSKNISTITERAFYNCSSLKDLEIPNGITTIEKEAFNGCSTIETLTLSKPLCSIGDVAFDNCTALKNIMYSSTLEDWCSIDFGNNALCYSNKLYINGKEIIGDVVLPNSVTKIPAYTFQNCTQITSITIPNTVTSVGKYAFNGCTKLNDITIPISVNKIESYAFSDCVNLKSIEIENDATNIESNAFSNCTNIESAIIPTVAITYIPKNSLKTVTINGGTNIPNEAFLNCATLTSVTILNSVTNIGSSVFSGCSSLESLTIPFVGGSANATSASASTLFGYIFGKSRYTGDHSTEQYYSSNYSIYYFIPLSLKNVTVTGGNIHYGAFYNCSNLKSITIGEGVTSIGENAFYYCTKLEEINFSAINSKSSNNVFYNAGVNGDGIKVTIGKEVTIIPAYLFYAKKYNYSTNVTTYYPPKITSLIFEEGSVCRSIGKYAFYNCTSLEEINFNAIAMDDLYYENYIFYNAGKTGEGIKVTIGKEVTKIPAYLFYPHHSQFDSSTGITTNYTPKITSVTFEESSVCQSIGDLAFFGCSSLANITIPDTVTSIGSSAFNGCGGLRKVDYLGTIEEWCNISFGNSTANPFYNLYINGELVTELVIPDTVTIIKAYAFSGGNFTSVTIPDSVTSIGESAFEYCDSLTSVTIGNGVSSIGERAFSSCYSLTSVTIGNSVTSIGQLAFNGCKSLTIYCEATSQPSSWDTNWNDYRPVCWYSEEEPTTEGNYWHYGDNGEIVIWK